jgi:hypothetical protein
MNDNIEKFRELLAENKEWPMLYYFKELFADPAAITYNSSRDIRFISLSCKQMMPDTESILEIYRKASLVDGLIAL